jgi:hypothetical protein
VPAIQFLGTRGFFASYDARPDDPMTMDVADVWLEAIAGDAQPPAERARRVRSREVTGASPCSTDHFLRRMDCGRSSPVPSSANGRLSRATASEWCYRAILQGMNGRG